MTESEHEWEPLLGWVGRYSCKAHGCLGYRGLVVADPGDATSRGRSIQRIIPYLCCGKRKVDGQSVACKRAAVRARERDSVGRHRSGYVCAEHKDL